MLRDDDEPAYVAWPDEDRFDPTLADDLKSLAGEARAYAIAEMRFQKARAAYAGAQARAIAVYGVVAAVLVFFAAMAFVVGLVIALGPWLTPWGAMALVTLALLVLAFLSLLAVKRRAAALSAAIGPEGPAPEELSA